MFESAPVTELSADPVPFRERLWRRGRLLVVLLGAQILIMLVVGVVVAASDGLASAGVCFFIPVFLGAGLAINMFIFARRERHHLLRAKVHGEVVELEFMVKDEVSHLTAPASALRATVGKAMGKGRKLIYLRIQDDGGTTILEQHRTPTWTLDRLGALLEAIRRAQGEEVSARERRRLERGW